jgi:hypothetical protein
MVVDSLQQTQPIIRIKGKSYHINVKEYESFIQQCEKFMCVDDEGIETMIQVVTDQLIDNANPNTTIEELRPQLKFIREVSFLLRNLLTPAEEENEN